jgi:carbon-monoxide dehydrogenase iron sulfur subunit
VIVVDPEKCSGCLRCEVTCSFFHTGKVGRSRARIKVVKIEELGIDYPVICCQCKERYCVKCPESAINIGPLGQLIVSTTLCTACGICQALCPIGAIELYEDIPFLCDLCGGEPRCVLQCNMGALEYTPGNDKLVSLKPFKKGSRDLNPEEKRVLYALNRTNELRDKWKSKDGG